MVDPIRNKKHGDCNDDVAKADRPGQKNRDRKIREGGQDIGEEFRRNNSAE